MDIYKCQHNNVQRLLIEDDLNREDVKGLVINPFSDDRVIINK